MKRDLGDYYLWIRKSNLCHTVCERDDSYADVGYRKLDKRVAQTIRNSRWNEENPDICAREIDEYNLNTFLKSEAEVEEITKDCGKRLYHYLQRPTVYLGGNK
jgi:hypothetical protein